SRSAPASIPARFTPGGVGKLRQNLVGRVNLRDGPVKIAKDDRALRTLTMVHHILTMHPFKAESRFMNYEL
ncbi:MAG TPA: hypothetical protein VEN79_17445, partial [Terriglobia bacterium]|nr:hypothetical protein [Terriglobia bacterium]